MIYCVHLADGPREKRLISTELCLLLEWSMTRMRTPMTGQSLGMFSLS